MARTRLEKEQILDILREIEQGLASGSDVEAACRSVGISDETYYAWQKKYGGIEKGQLRDVKQLEKENAQLKKIVAELVLDKLILKESLDFLKPKV